MTLPIAIALLALYALFLWWYGGKGAPLTASEIARFEREIGALPAGPGRESELAAIRELLASDDGREFVMVNLVRHRPQALYPGGFRDACTDARAADRRYGRLIIWPLLRQGSLPVFIAPRTGRFLEAAGAEQWDYVAMVRYRSRRDFLRFALTIEREHIVAHKWAAIERTHVFPVRPMLSLVFVRGAVAALLAVCGVILCALAS